MRTFIVIVQSAELPVEDSTNLFRLPIPPMHLLPTAQRLRRLVRSGVTFLCVVQGTRHTIAALRDWSGDSAELLLMSSVPAKALCPSKLPTPE